MVDLDLSKLKKRGLSILRMEAADWYDLEASRGGGARFTLVFPYEVARQATARAPVLIVLPGGELTTDRYYFEDDRKRPSQLKLGWIGSIQKVATRQTRLAIDHVMSITPATLAELLGSEAPTRFRTAAADLLQSTAELGGLTPRFGEWVLDRIAAIPGNGDALARLTALVNLPKRFDSALALQLDALGLALRAFGAPAPRRPGGRSGAA